MDWSSDTDMLPAEAAASDSLQVGGLGSSVGLGSTGSTSHMAPAQAMPLSYAPWRAEPMPLIRGLGADCEMAACTLQGIDASFSVSACAPVFEGHYPDLPVLPGVFLIEAAWQAIEAQAAQLDAPPPRLRSLSALRFFAPVGPDTPVRIEVRPVAQPADTGTMAWDIHCFRADQTGETRAARMRLCADDGANPLSVVRTERVWTKRRTAALHASDVLQRLAHRYPMLMVDRVVHLAPNHSLVAEKAISLNDPCYRGIGHAKAAALAYPYALLLESFVQSAGLLMTDGHAEQSSQTMLFGSLGQAEFLSGAWPGEVVRQHVYITKRFGDSALLNGESVIGNRVVARLNDVLVAVRPHSVIETALRRSAALS